MLQVDACDLPGRWIADLDMGLRLIVGPLILVQAFWSIRSNRRPILGSDALGHVTLPLERRCGVVCEGARPAGLGFRPILVHVHLKSQLIQNLWNLLELNKI